MKSSVPAPVTFRRAGASLWLMGVVIGALLGIVAVAYAYFVVFSHVRGDDEGYLMISVLGFLEGNPLYDAVFTQYGPFYYLYQWLLRTVASVPLTHDATRLLCIAHWLSASLLLALAGGMITRSVLGGLFMFAQAVMHLTAIANEPGHPQELVSVLLALGIFTVSVARRLPLMLAILGALGAALALTKVNVGAFFCVAVLMAMHAHGSGPIHRWVWSAVALGAFAVLPFLLMRSHLGEPWFRNYSLTVSVAVVTCFLAARAWACRALVSMRAAGAFAVGFGLSASAILGLALWHGSSVHGLVEGLIVTPMKLPGVGMLRRAVSDGVLPNAAVALAVGIWLTRDFAARGLPHFLLILKGLYGVIGTLWLVGKVGLQLDYLLPWVWLVIVPAPGEDFSSRDRTFPRVFLAFAATWQALQAYPVAGTQVAVGTCLLVIAYTVCLADAVRGLGAFEWIANRLGPNRAKAAAAKSWLLGACVLFLFANLWSKPHVWRERYVQLIPLDLPGTQRLRLERESVDVHQALIGYLAASSDTFITYPGYNSFYFWTGKRPPTFWNATGWGPLSEAQRLEVLVALRRAKRAMIIIHENILKGWANHVPGELEPLVLCVRDECEPVRQFGPFVVFRLVGAKGP
jgi:hypothetical protein